jgi:hypothetical protein
VLAFVKHWRRGTATIANSLNMSQELLRESILCGPAYALQYSWTLLLAIRRTGWSGKLLDSWKTVDFWWRAQPM